MEKRILKGTAWFGEMATQDVRFLHTEAPFNYLLRVRYSGGNGVQVDTFFTEDEVSEEDAPADTESECFDGGWDDEADQAVTVVMTQEELDAQAGRAS